MLKDIFFGGAGGGSKLADLGLLICRLFTGVFLALGHGITKLPPGEQFVNGLQGMGVPAPTLAAWAAMFGEFFCGLLLAMGLFTRPAAALIAITMLVAVLTAHGSDPLYMKDAMLSETQQVDPEGRTVITQKRGGAKEFALLYMLPAILFICAGSGRFGVDALIRQRLAQRIEPGGFETASVNPSMPGAAPRREETV